MSQEVITLKEFGEDRFLEELHKLRELNSPADRRNRNWFQVLPITYKKYEDWFFLVDDDEVLFWTAIQKYYSGCFRIFTRSYRYIPYRRFKKDCVPSLSEAVLPRIIDSLGHYDTIFMSMQQPRRNALKQYGEALVDDWILHPQLMQTCKDGNDKNCWQNIIYNGVEPLLHEISISEWDKKFNANGFNL